MKKFDDLLYYPAFLAILLSFIVIILGLLNLLGMINFLPFTSNIRDLILSIVAIVGVWQYYDKKERELNFKHMDNRFAYIKNIARDIKNDTNLSEVLYSINLLKFHAIDIFKYYDKKNPRIEFISEGDKDINYLVLNYLKNYLSCIEIKGETGEHFTHLYKKIEDTLEELKTGKIATSGSANPPRNDNPSMAGEAYKPTAVGSQ